MSRHHNLFVVLPISTTDVLEQAEIREAIESFEEDGGETGLRHTEGGTVFWMEYDGEASDRRCRRLIQPMHTVGRVADTAAEIDVYVEDAHASGEGISNAQRFVGPSAEARAWLMVEAHVCRMCNDLSEVGMKVPGKIRRDLIDHCFEACAPADDDPPGPSAN